MAEKPKKPFPRARLHLLGLLAELLCASAFVIELRRAIQGNSLSWAYVFEWPILGAYGVYVWKKLLRDDTISTPVRAPGARDVAADAARARYNDYLGRVHRAAPGAADQRPEPRQPTRTPLTKAGDASVE